LAILGIFCTAIAHTFWGRANAKLPAKMSAMIYFLVPIYASAIAFFWLGETISVKIVAGGFLIFLGNYLLMKK
jgi:drug/metabolite transporter (DMT)-like permease